MSQSLEEMTQAYTVAMLQSGISPKDVPTKQLIELAEDIKRQARIADETLERHDNEDRRRRW